jgi:hypothetical protein
VTGQTGSRAILYDANPSANGGGSPLRAHRRSLPTQLPQLPRPKPPVRWMEGREAHAPLLACPPLYALVVVLPSQQDRSPRAE